MLECGFPSGTSTLENDSTVGALCTKVRILICVSKRLCVLSTGVEKRHRRTSDGGAWFLYFRVPTWLSVQGDDDDVDDAGFGDCDDGCCAVPLEHGPS